KETDASDDLPAQEEYDEYDNGEVSEAEKEFDFSDYMDDETPAYRLSSQNHNGGEEKSMPVALGTSFHEYLASQIGLKQLDEKQEVIAKHLIGSLDESGYLRRELPSVADDLAFSQNLLVTSEEV